MDYILTFRDQDKDRIETGFALQNGYQDTIVIGQDVDGNPIYGPNPQTKGDFLIATSRKFILNSILSTEVKTAIDTARRLAEAGAIDPAAISAPK